MEKEIQYNVRSSDLEAEPMQESVEEYNNENDINQNSKETFCYQILNSGTVRVQIARSVCVSAAHMINGWTKSQIGAAFPDIMMISGADLEKGSAFLTSIYTGHLLGAVLAGAIYFKMNKFLVFGTSLVLSSLILAAIPWCFLYELMVAAFAFLGVCGGIISVGISAECVSIWGPTSRGRSYILANSAAFAISGLLAPLVTAPFLLNQPVQSLTNKTYTSWNTTYISPIWINGTTQSSMNDIEISKDNSTLSNGSVSKLYIAYTISAVLTLFVAVLFFLLFCQLGAINLQKPNNDVLEFIGTRSLLIKRLQLFNAGVFCLIEHGIDYTFTGYLAVFCINYLGWTKTLGATLTSLVFFSRMLGILIGIILVRFIKSHQSLLFTTLLSTVGFIGLLVSAYFFCDVGIWISVCAIGISFGFMWPNLLSWINESLIPVRSEMASFLVVTAYLGALLSPLLVGYLMEEVSLLWFCYLFCFKSIVITGNSVLMFLYTVSKDAK